MGTSCNSCCNCFGEKTTEMNGFGTKTIKNKNVLDRYEYVEGADNEKYEEDEDQYKDGRIPMWYQTIEREFNDGKYYKEIYPDYV